ncbi:MarR family winged helix-turn-helix transcriptional regulator [Bhargavaea beijingensis]|uniref:MarR family winged helix-turn-helix transcriptional regulator n=1 Tax=Bhargavaea beijingensis TaxID=426756 RepID=UPI00222486EC|nr:MarR family transcriptional regulator [Bhargavaea beijingensis]MCW1929319.1 MarR family transcriptional regulator [Bhargavaea beijingensis]
MELKAHQVFFRRFTDLYRPFIQKTADILAEEGLTLPQWSTIRLIAEQEEMTPAELASRQYVEKPTVSRTVQQLLELGLIETRQGRDRREKKILLTDEGNQIYEKASRAIEKLEREVSDGISEQEMDAMSGRFAEMRRRL